MIDLLYGQNPEHVSRLQMKKKGLKESDLFDETRIDNLHHEDQK